MNKLINTLLICLISFTAFGQSIEELKNELSYFKGGETYTDKIDYARKLLKLEPFNDQAIDYIFRYYEENKIDSISVFFDNLADKYPDRIEPFLLRSELLYFEYDFGNKLEYVAWKVNYLDKAYKIDKQNPKVLFALAETYYKDFIYPFEKVPDYGWMLKDDENLDSTLLDPVKETKVSTFKHAADSALKYFYRIWDLNHERQLIYYSIKQLECFLKKRANPSVTDEIMEESQYCYFPPWYFANLEDDWKRDLSKDYLFGIEMSKRNADDLSSYLSDLEEPCMYNKNVSDDYLGFRFLWVRSFDNPIIVRLEKSENECTLNWILGKGSGGYNPKGIKRKGKKRVSKKEFNEFLKLFDDLCFDQLPNEFYVPMTDGASWVLEAKSKEKYKAFKTNWPHGNFKQCCLYLLDLTDIRVKKDDIY